MKTNEFDYDLPSERIAQFPLEPRDASRLLVLDRSKNSLVDSTFRNIEDYLTAGDVLVLNQTRVIPARLFARKETGGKVEILLLKKIDDLHWRGLIGGKHVALNAWLQIDERVSVRIVSLFDGSERLVEFNQPVEPYLMQHGQMPLPPYIHAKLDDPERYQTVFAQITGSAAAPTAGLHFTPDLLTRLQAKGVEIARVTLHVGLDTFLPVNEENVEDHRIHSEWCELDAAAAASINQAVKAGKKVFAVGTTSVRTLESAADPEYVGQVLPFSGDTRLFIYPGYQFKVVNGLITNFHLPKSSLIMLVSAFAGKETILNAYRHAVEKEYRFYSFGDAMLIL